jgi:nucleotide-binding universal stress UspA family protein
MSKGPAHDTNLRPFLFDWKRLTASRIEAARRSFHCLAHHGGIGRTPLPVLYLTMFNILLVPLDGSPQSNQVIDLASRVATPGTATLHLLCVVDPSYVLPPGDESDSLSYPAASAQTSFAQSVLAAGAAQLANRNLTVQQHFCAGNPADVVIGQARLLTADLIVMGHHHLSRLRRWANPSTSGEVIDRSPCAVLIETRD